MSFFGKVLIVVTICFFISGCTLRFKGKDIELETETPKEIQVAEYRLDRADFL